jgi:hypothetical protein
MTKIVYGCKPADDADSRIAFKIASIFGSAIFTPVILLVAYRQLSLSINVFIIFYLK